MAFGLFWLMWILFSTVTKGFDGMSWALFTEMTPPPNTDGGGLANAIVGSGLLILWATVIGTPFGDLSGYLPCQYGRRSWLAEVIRFINDILLSAHQLLLDCLCIPFVVPTNAALFLVGRVLWHSVITNTYCYSHHGKYVEVWSLIAREAAYALGTPSGR